MEKMLIVLSEVALSGKKVKSEMLHILQEKTETNQFLKKWHTV